jgi:hypothetical protein
MNLRVKVPKVLVFLKLIVDIFIAILVEISSTLVVVFYEVQEVFQSLESLLSN